MSFLINELHAFLLDKTTAHIALLGTGTAKETLCGRYLASIVFLTHVSEIPRPLCIDCLEKLEEDMIELYAYV